MSHARNTYFPANQTNEQEMKKMLNPTNKLRKAKIASFISDMLTNRSMLSLFDAAVAASVCLSMSRLIRLSFP
jgi:hypothetical protein